MRLIDLTDKRFGMLTVIERSKQNSKNGVMWICECDCGNIVNKLGTYLKTGDTKSCGCLKRSVTDETNLRDKYEEKRVDGVVMPLFKGREPRKDSATGYRGVGKYYTRKSKEVRYKAWITVVGERKYKYGFRTAEDAYGGRLELERLYLPKEQ